MIRWRVRCVTLLCCFALSATPGSALVIGAVGSWSVPLGTAELTAGPGSDFESTHTSMADQVVITISDAIDENEQWFVDVSHTSGGWDGSVQVKVVRISDGTGLGTISGGTALQAVDGTPALLFEGTGNRDSIFIQIVLTGVSVTLGSDLFETQLTFTLRDSL